MLGRAFEESLPIFVRASHSTHGKSGGSLFRFADLAMEPGIETIRRAQRRPAAWPKALLGKCGE